MVNAIISDIHSNLEATIAVLDEIERRGVNKIICLGDVVGYGANPNECCDILRKVSNSVVLGNHDAGSTGITRLSYFNKIAAYACVWSARVLTRQNRRWLKTLPITLVNDTDLVVHSSPSNPTAWDYILSLEDAIKEFNAFDSHLCFVGHSHVPVTFVKKDNQYDIIHPANGEVKFTLDTNAQYIINPGSVGQPRDGDPRASFAIYNKERKEIEIIRVPYGIETAKQKILDARLQRFLAYRLATGT